MYVVYVWEWESKAEGGECEMERTGDSRVKNEIEGQTYESERTIQTYLYRTREPRVSQRQQDEESVSKGWTMRVIYVYGEG